MSDIKKMYKTIMADDFPPEMTITLIPDGPPGCCHHEAQ